MSKNSLAIILNASQEYVMEISRDSGEQNTMLFSAISQTYLPLLDMLSRLEEDQVPCKIGLVLPSSLCTLLADPRLQKLYIDHLDRRIALGESECKRLSSDAVLLEQAMRCLNRAKKDRSDFTETYNQDILGALKTWAKKGFLELIPTAATGAFLSHYADMTEVLNAQIETGLYAQRQFFGDTGEGFFLPYQAYSTGIEKVLRAYGVTYTVLDARALLFSKDGAQCGIFSPVRTGNSLVIFGSDPFCEEEISGEEGYSKNAVYLSEHFDIGFDLDSSDLKSFSMPDEKRLPTLYRYWANAEGQERVVYDEEKAKAQAERDAETFVQKRMELLLNAEKSMSSSGEQSPLLVCTIPAELIGQRWNEGIFWLESLIRKVEASQSVELSFCKNHVQNQFELPKIRPYPCASSGSGYGENFLDSSNSWMTRYVRKASERMVDLAERFPSETGLKARLLNIAAREVLLAQSCEWQRMVSEGILPDEAASQFKEHILAFTVVFDSLASNTVSTEWLTRIEKEHAIFPWINYRIFSRKK